MIEAVTCNNMTAKLSIVLSIVGVWIKNWDLSSELVEFQEFGRMIGIYN